MPVFFVEVAPNGLDGFSKIKEYKPDLVLVDVVMPVMGGLEMITKMKEDNNNTPFIVISNLSDDESVKKAFNSGGLDYLIKTDLRIDEIVSRVKEILL